MSKGSPQQGGAGGLPSWLGMARNYTMPQGGAPGGMIPGTTTPLQPPSSFSGGDAPPPMYPGGLPQQPLTPPPQGFMPPPGGPQVGPMQPPPGLFGNFGGFYGGGMHPALAGLLNHFGNSFGNRNNFTMPQGTVPPGLPPGVTTPLQPLQPTPQQPPSGLFGRGISLNG